MPGVTVTTDRKWKPFKYRYDVPTRVLASQFDYQDEDDAMDGFFRYRGVWYHIDQFMRASGAGSPLADWQGYHSDSAFSGVVLRVSRDGESYMVGTYCA